jgi:hypothetical protein
MHILNPYFPPITADQADGLYEFFLNRCPSIDEQRWLTENANDNRWITNGVMAFSAPWDPNKKTLFLYTCCHGAQLMSFWLKYSTSQHITQTYNLCLAQNYRAQGDKNYSTGKPPGNVAGIPDTHRDIFLALFRKADVVITHPAYGGSDFSPESLIAMTQPNVRVIKFHSPSFAALWPVCFFGDAWAKELLRKGATPDAIIRQLRDGSVNCQLQARWEVAFDRLVRKDKIVDIDIARFFKRHWQRHRMFTTFNHPTFTLMGYQALRLEHIVEGRDGKEVGILDYAMILGLPWDCCQMRPLWPDHPQVRRELGVRYPDFIGDTEGFYAKEIWRCWDEVQTERK